MLNHGIGSWPARRARMSPHATAFRFEDASATYAQVHDRVLRVAGALRDLGVGRGDRVAYLGPNHPHLLEVMFGAGLLGAVFVPLNTRLAPAEIAYMLQDSAAGTLVYAPTHRDLVATVRDGVPATTFLALAADDDVAAGRSLHYDAAVSGRPAEPVDEPVTLDDACLILYTSGTTGRPKGAALTHGNLTWNTYNVLIDLDLTRNEVSLVNAPLFHVAALDMVFLPTFIKGGTTIIAPRFDPSGTLRSIADDRVTFTFGVPAMYAAMAALPEFAMADLSSLRTAMCGGAPVPPHLTRTYRERGVDLQLGYGMTETGPALLFRNAADTVRKPDTSGVPSFFVDVRVVDPALNPVATGERGQVVAEGPNVMPGYWRRPDATAEALTPDGWMLTGDVGVIDEDGFLTVVDRVKDMYISGGENVYPAEVEAVLLEHPAVADVAVIGVADPIWGEVGKAFVVPAPGQDVSAVELAAHAARSLARYKVPKHVETISELPRSGAGKVLKHRLHASHTTTRESS